MLNKDNIHLPSRNISAYALINIPIASNSHPMYRPLLFSIIIMDINSPMIMNPKETMFNVELTITFICFYAEGVGFEPTCRFTDLTR